MVCVVVRANWIVLWCTLVLIECPVNVCDVALGEKDVRRLINKSGMLNDEVSPC